MLSEILIREHADSREVVQTAVSTRSAPKQLGHGDDETTLSNIIDGRADRPRAKWALQVGMARLWSRVLETGPVGLDDDFFQLNPVAR